MPFIICLFCYLSPLSFLELWKMFSQAEEANKMVEGVKGVGEARI
jgi:hypothetical protein